MLFFSCHSQKMISLKQMNDHLLKTGNLFPYSMSSDSAMIKMLIKGYTTYRLSGAESCNIDPNKKYSHIYIEDGFHNEEGFYNGIIVLDNKCVCEITNSQYKLKIDSLSYTKTKKKDIIYGGIVFYTKKLSMEDFKKKYIDEYFRYQLVVQNKVNNFKKCLNIDEYTPKSPINLRSYYFYNKDIEEFHIPFEYYFTIKKNGLNYLPYLKEEKKKEFLDCIDNLNILTD